jgi:signal transduction histidine kinase
MSELGTTTPAPARRAVHRSLFGLQLALLALVTGVASRPLIAERRWPGALTEWILTLAPAAAALVAALLFVIGTANGRTQRRRLIASSDTLRAALRRGAAGDDALRVSTERRKFGARRLSDVLERSRVGAEDLRLSVASGVATDEKLRLSVASGAVTDEKLRLSVVAGVEGAEALRVSIARGIDAASTTLAVVDTVDAAITLYAPEGHILLTNDTARALAVLARSGDLDPLEFADDRVTPIPRFDQVLARAARGQLVTRRAYWVGTGDAQRAIMSTSQFVRRASGELIGTVVASHDVTPLARTRDEFLETVSHELRTPLTSMIGYLEIIEDALDLEHTGISQEFEVIQRNTDRLLRLINDLLLTAQGEPPSDPRPCDLTALAGTSLNTIRMNAASAGVRLTFTAVDAVTAEVDADRINDVFDKVLSNALKFNRPGGGIEVSVLSADQHAIVRITDTGVGMTAPDRQRMFERFYRAPSARLDMIAGAGLGLTTAKIIVEAHHGSIEAVSTVAPDRRDRSPGSRLLRAARPEAAAPYP